MSLDLEHLARHAGVLAERAAAAILDVYVSDFAVEQKDDRSPLTAADLASHRVIVEGLHALAPALPVLSEESADIAWAERASWTRYWLVDPLDGTREFIKRNGEFTVNIALIDGGEPVLGVVTAPALGTAAQTSVDLCWAARTVRARVEARAHIPVRKCIAGANDQGKPQRSKLVKPEAFVSGAAPSQSPRAPS